jgi:type I restriction enzyme, S subunit
VKTQLSTETFTPWQQENLPEWQLTQVKYHFDVVLGKMLQNSQKSPDDIEVSYLKAQHVQWDQVIFDDLPTMWARPEEVAALALKKDDLLVCEGGEVGRAAFVPNTPSDDCIIQNALHLVRAKEDNDLRFLRYFLIYATSIEWIDVICNRATIAHFTSEKFKSLWLWLPNGEEIGRAHV